MDCNVARRQVCIALHHLDGFPASEFFQDKERSTALDVPTGPGMPEIVPMEVLDSSDLASAIKVAPIILLNAGVKVISTRKNQRFAARPLPALPESPESAFKDCAGVIIQRHCTCIARFSAFMGNPGILLRQIDLWGE